MACGAGFMWCQLPERGLVSVGSNEAGKLGIGPGAEGIARMGGAYSTPQPVRFEGGVVESIHCGMHFVYLLAKGGTQVWSCGKNDSHQLGLDHTTPQGYPVVCDAFAGKTLKKLVCGEACVWAVDNEDGIWVVGRQACGELGLGHTNLAPTLSKADKLSGLQLAPGDPWCGATSMLFYGQKSNYTEKFAKVDEVAEGSMPP